MNIDIDFCEVNSDTAKKELALYQLINGGKDNIHKVILASFDNNNVFWGVCIEGVSVGHIGMYDQSQFRKLPSKTKVTLIQE